MDFLGAGACFLGAGACFLAAVFGAGRLVSPAGGAGLLVSTVGGAGRLDTTNHAWEALVRCWPRARPPTSSRPSRGSSGLARFVLRRRSTVKRLEKERCNHCTVDIYLYRRFLPN